MNKTMIYKIILETKEYEDEFGHHAAEHKEFDIPYKYWEKVWYCYKKRKKYVVQECRITSVWATNIVGVTLNNSYYVDEDEFDRLFKDKNEAIDWCLKQNQRETVKVYEK